MSFYVDIYVNSSPTNKINKSLTQTSHNLGTLRAGSSIIDPVIIFEVEQAGWPYTNANYMHIPEFNRYYFITNIISKNNMIWEIHGHVDVLMSFSDAILAQTAIVSRQQGQYNMYLDDGSFMAYQNPIIQTKRFSVDGPFEQQEFVLVVAGSQSGGTNSSGT